MSKVSNLYEKLVQEQARKIAESRKIKLMEQPRYGRSNKIDGASGFSHQIDISVKYISRNGKHRLRLIECKLRTKDKIGLGDILCFHARIVDIQKCIGEKIKVEGNFFTTVGYTSGAIGYAKSYGIATNSMQTDGQGWSISFADDVVIGLRLHNLKTTAPQIKISE
jgi:hypothetical protein